MKQDFELNSIHIILVIDKLKCGFHAIVKIGLILCIDSSCRLAVHGPRGLVRDT